jgi:glycerol-3-phosphate dehydrogenase
MVYLADLCTGRPYDERRTPVNRAERKLPAVDAEVAVIGAGVVGSATALALARRGASVVLLEAEREPGLGASGTNSGILHTGFDSPSRELETELILRSATLRDPLLAALDLPVLRCGALLRPLEDGDAAVRLGAELRAPFTVAAIARSAGGLELSDAAGTSLRARVAVNCAGLHADDVARLVGDDTFEIYPRKGEFLVFDPPAGDPLERILLPVPTKRTKGVLVFPTIDGKVVAGPTAIDQDDKGDWGVRPEARDEIVPKAARMWPPLEGARQVAAYAGLRPAGRGVNYVIGPSAVCRELVNVAAIRSTGLTASLGIAEHLCRTVEDLGVRLAPERPLEAAATPAAGGPWWRRTAEHRAA